MSTILIHLDSMTPGQRYAVQFCPDCQHRGGLDYLVCQAHQSPQAAEEPAPHPLTMLDTTSAPRLRLHHREPGYRLTPDGERY